MLKAHEIESERKYVDSDSSFQMETRSSVKRWAPVRPSFRGVHYHTDSESMAYDSDASSYRFMKWKPRTSARERVSIETSSTISKWPASPIYQESDSESVAGSETSSYSISSKTKVKIWKPMVPPKPKKYIGRGRGAYESKESFESRESSIVSIDTSSSVKTFEKQPRPYVRPTDIDETSITKKSEMKVSLGGKAPKATSLFKMNAPTSEPEEVDVKRSMFKTQLSRKAEKFSFGGTTEESDYQMEVSEAELEDQRRSQQERMTIFSRKSEQKIAFEPKGAQFGKESAKVKLGVSKHELDESRRTRSQETRAEFARKAEQKVHLQSKGEKKPTGTRLDMLQPEIAEKPKRRPHSLDARTEVATKSRLNIYITETESAGEESETFFNTKSRVKQLPTPTPDKLVIEGELYPQKPMKQKRERVHKQGAPKSSLYKPVPYFSGPSSIVVPERRDVLLAAETWRRYRMDWVAMEMNL